MGLELIVFISAILFGVFLYWRESKNNSIYRFVDKIFNSKELQIEEKDSKGFVYKRTLIPRIIFIVSLVLIAALILEFLTPISIFGSYYGVSSFASFALGTLLGTYLANFVIKTTEVVEEKSGSIEDLVSDTFEKGKDFIEDITHKDKENATSSEVEKNKIDENPKAPEKSARERLKDKGLM